MDDARFRIRPEGDRYTCPAGKELVQFLRTYAIPGSSITAEATRGEGVDRDRDGASREQAARID
jgi:hypothetical protein